MLLTKENYELIIKYLLEHGIKDIDFPSIVSEEVNKEDLLTIVHLFGNRKITLLEFQKALLKVVVYNEGTTPIEDTLLSHRTDAALSANQGRVLNEKIDNYRETPADYTTIIKVGELDENTDVSGLTAQEILEKILYAEYIPYYVAGTVSLEVPATTKSVGDKLFSEANCTLSSTKAYTKTKGKPTAYSGDADTDKDSITVATNTLGQSNGNVTWDTTVYKAGTIKLNYSRTLKDGTAEVVTTKNKATNELASGTSETTKVGKGTVDDGTKLVTKTDPTTYYVVKGLTYTDSKDINFVYPVYITTGTTVTKLDTATTYGASLDISHAATTASPFKFKIPTSFTNVKLYYYDSVNRNWVQVTTTAGTSTDTEIGSTKLKVKYTEYSFADNSGSRPYKITFTR